MEDRTTPALQASFSATPAIVTFTEASGLGTSDTLYLRVDTVSGNLEWSANGVTFTQDLDTTVAGIQSSPAADLRNINANLGGGDDAVSIDVNGRDLIRSNLITYDGGSGSNSLSVTGTPAASATVTNTTYMVGPSPGQGRLAYSSSAGPMTINFTNLAPVTTFVPTTVLRVEGTNADNAITYSSLMGEGFVSVDGFERIGFASATTLQLAGGGGRDTFSLNGQSVPVGLTAVEVFGGDPTDGDTLSYTGLAGTPDLFVISPTGTGAGRIADGTRPAVTFDGLSGLSIVGQVADLDRLQYTGTNGSDTIMWTAGEAAFSGSIRGEHLFDPPFVGSVPGFSFTPLTYQGIRDLALGSGFGVGSVNLAGAYDRIVLRGTSGNDSFDNAGFLSFGAATGFYFSTDSYATIIAFDKAGGVGGVTLAGMGGRDTFRTDFGLGLPQIDYQIDGDGDDALSYTTPTGTPSSLMIYESDGPYGPYTYSEISTPALTRVRFRGLATLSMTLNNQPFTYQYASFGGNDIAVTPLGPTSGRVEAGPGDPVVSFSGASTVTVTSSAFPNRDNLTVNGSEASDTITAMNDAVTVVGKIPVRYFAGGFAEITVNGLVGNDSLAVESTVTTPIIFNGGTGTRDELVLQGRTNANDGFTYTPGVDNRSGQAAVGSAAVQFTGAEDLRFHGGGGTGQDTLMVNGTYAPDTFTVIGIDPGPLGFAFVALNDGPLINYQFAGSDGSGISLVGWGGDDTFSVRGRPNWGIRNITVLAEDPSGSDTVIVTGTDGDDVFTYTPSINRLTAGVFGDTPTTYGLFGVESLIVDGLGNVTPSSDKLYVTEFVPYWVPGGGPIAGDMTLTPRRIELVVIHALPLAGPDTATIAEDNAVNVSVLANDTGLADAPLTVSITGGPAHGSVVVLGGVVRYTPAANYHGTDVFTYRVTDANGEWSEATVTVTVTPVNDPPVTTDDSYTVAEDGVLTVGVPGVRANDTDADGDPLVVSLVGGPAHGTLTLNPDGSFVYTPAKNYVGPDAFTYRVDDGAGGVATATVRITVNERGDEIFVVGAGPGGGPHVKVYTAGRVQKSTFFAYDPAFRGGVSVAVGDVNGDGTPDIVTGAGAGGAPHVKVFDGVTGAELRSFLAFDGAFGGGVSVAAGDVDGDGFADLVVGAAAGGGPRVCVFSGKTGAEVLSFFAYDAGFTGGVNVAAGDLDGDGKADIVTGAGVGGGPHVRAFTGDLTRVLDFMAANPDSRNGVSVAIGNVQGDGRLDLVTGTPGVTQVVTFDGHDLREVSRFPAADPSYAAGVHVGTFDWDGDGRDELLLGAGPGGEARVRIADGVTGGTLDEFFPLDIGFRGGVWVS